MYSKAVAVKLAYKAALLTLKKEDSKDSSGEAGDEEASAARLRSEIVSSLTAADPDNVALAAEAHLLSASLGDGGGDAEKVAALSMSLRFKETVTARVARGSVHRARRRYHQALQDFEKALRMEPEHEEAKRWEWRGYCEIWGFFKWHTPHFSYVIRNPSLSCFCFHRQIVDNLT